MSRARPQSHAAAVLVGTLVIVAVACFGGPSPFAKAMRLTWPVVPHTDLAAEATKYTGVSCSITGESLSGRADPAECGPFPCSWGKCYVDKCTPGHACGEGICSDGYCIRIDTVGSKSCSRLDVKPWDLKSNDIAGRAGCACTPQNLAALRDSEICGSFPCSPDGCYVARCKGDSDCKVGLCSNHASAPHGYCVTDDPH